MGKHLTSEQIEQMRLYKAEGHTQEEVGRLFGVCEETARKYCKGISPMDKFSQFQKRTEEQFDAIVRKYNSNWRYKSGYTSGDCRINIQCTICGTIFNRSMNTIRHKHAERCVYCLKLEKEKVREQVEEIKRIRHEQAIANRPVLIAKARAKQREATKQRQEARRHDCPICGESTTRPKYCSNKCSVIANTRKNNSVHEARRRTKLKAVVVDKGITLKKLYDRDGGRCWICGMVCDYADKTYTDKTMIAGNMYPSIDHVVALSDGGAHAWDNVKLAHRICNSLRYYAPHI